MDKKVKSYISRTEARATLPALIDRVMDGEGPITIMQRGKEQAVIMSTEEYKQIKKPKKKFSETGLAGIWADRKDMEGISSVDWVNNLRKNEERRNRNYQNLSQKPIN